MTLKDSSELADAIRFMRLAEERFLALGQPLLAMRVGALIQEATLRRG